MAITQNIESVLFRTSAATDVQCSAGMLSVAGLTATRKVRITDFRFVRFRAETVQVVTLTTTYTPQGSTAYTLEFGDINREIGGYQSTLPPYSYTTPADVTTLGATAALQREAIAAQLVTKINALTSTNYVTAASSGGGTGITLTDSAGYYPVFQQGVNNRQGATQVYAVTNADGSGLTQSMLSITTAAVYSSGVGADLALTKPVIDSMYQNLISGYLQTLGNFAPTTKSATAASNNLPAVSGQKYDTFVINSLALAQAHNQRGQEAYIQKIQGIFVDNGVGTDTTNASGYQAFARELYRHLFAQYATDPSSIVDFFDNALTASATYPTTGAAISTTDNVVMSVNSNQNTWYVNPIGTHTLLTPIVTTAGLIPQLDITTQEGIELSPPNLTQCPKEFVVGKSEGSFYARVTFTGIAATDWKTLSVGFRKKAAYAVDQTAYEAASVATACLGVPLDTGAAPVINIITGPGSAGALTNTSCSVSPGAGTSVDLLVTVDINGVARFYVNNIDKTGVLAATYTFTAGLHLMPFISFRNGANVSASPAIIQCAFVPSIAWYA